MIKVDRWIFVLSRVFDYCLFYLFAQIVLLSLPFYFDTLFYLLFSLLVPVLWAPIGALFLSKWQKTPGCMLLGLKLFKPTSFRSALKAMCYFEKLEFIRVVQKRGRRLIVALTLLSCVATGCFGKSLVDYSIGFERYELAKGWIDYTPQDGGFTVALPSEPEVETKKLEVPEANRTLTYDEYKSKTKKISYTVSTMELPKRWKLAGSNTLLKGAMKVILNSIPGSTLVKKGFTYHKKHPALDFLYKQGEEEVRGRLILVGNTLFRLTVSYPPTQQQEQLKHLEFLESFDLKP